MEIFDVRKWPDEWRHSFMILLPISGPIWLGGIVAFGAIYLVGMVFVVFVFLPLAFLRSVWAGEDSIGNRIAPVSTDDGR